MFPAVIYRSSEKKLHQKYVEQTCQTAIFCFKLNLKLELNRIKNISIPRTHHKVKQPKPPDENMLLRGKIFEITIKTTQRKREKTMACFRLNLLT